MLRHYITLAFRTLWRNKFHTAINVLGLSIGISACLVIYLIASHELGFNRQLADYDRIYRIHSKFTGTFAGLNRGVPSGVGPYVREHFKGIDDLSLFYMFGSKVKVPASDETKQFDDEESAIIASPEYFRVFNSYEWLTGSPEVLSKPNQVVLLESQAKKYFGDADIATLVGKEIIYRDSLPVNLAGVVKDLPFRSDLSFTDFISDATIDATWLKKSFPVDDWTGVSSSTQLFVKVSAGTSQEALLEQMPLLAKQYKEKSGWGANLFDVQPLSDLHFNADTGIFDFDNSVPAHLPTLITLLGVAFLLLVIGAINFINLETAQAVHRAKEVGVRKVLGSTRARLILQFLCEGLMLTLIAMVVAMPFTELGLILFSEFIPKGVTLNIGRLIPFLLGIIAFIGILASAYPAFVLSSFIPALALKNQASLGNSASRSAFLRKTLIVFQFTFAQVLIIGTLMIGTQIHYLLNKDMGFKKDAIVYFHTPWWENHNKTMALFQSLKNIPEISEISLSESPPAYSGWSSSVIKHTHEGIPMEVNASRKFGDENYLNFYDIKLSAGRNFQASDTLKEFLINETLMKQLGFSKPEDAIGEVIEINNRKIPVVGVVKDFHTQSLHAKVEPLIMASAINDFSCLNIKLSAASQSGEALQKSIGKIEAAWKKIYPDTPLKYKFLDETIRNFYKSEQRISKLSRTATGLAIVISCLGLFGLASYTTAQRTKEIGIRKVLGASVQQIVTLLSRDFIVLVIIAFVIAMPLAWFSINRWLEGFSYHAEPGIWMYILTAISAVAIAFGTVSYQTFRSAHRNPVESLRNE
ncbi:MAG TPA: ABC transporter permease [Ohtaekwangia sp.]|uniref:ABC transporter permease n=1 Tax=Ohtaekwangia sp. TaxID=2066019 RepID=UPI002F94E406